MRKYVERLPGFAANVAILLGALTLFGWVSGIHVLTQLFPGWASMKANTAICLVLAGIALHCLKDPAAERRHQVWGRVCALLVLAVALLTLAQYQLETNFGIDQLLMTDVENVSYPGRMSPHAAISLTLIALSLLLIDFEMARGIWPSQIGAIATLFVVLLALAGHLYGATYLYGLGDNGISFHAGVALFLLALGILAARSSRGFFAALSAGGSAGFAGRILLPGVVVVPIVLGWLSLVGARVGLYGSPYGAAMLITAVSLAFFLTTAHLVSLLSQVDARRAKAEDALKQAYRDIRQRVEEQTRELSATNKELRSEIRRREQTEHALRLSERRLALAQRAGSVGSFDWDMRTNTNLWSDELLALHGLRRDQFGGSYEDWLDRIVPDDRAKAEQAVQDALVSGVLKGEYRIRRHDTGEVRWMEARGEVHFDEKGKALRMVGINMDVTERKQAFEEKEKVSVLLDTLIGNAPIGFALFDLEGRFRLVNQWLAQINGVPVEGHAGKTVAEVVPSVEPQARQVFERVAATRHPVIGVEFSGATANNPALMRHFSESWFPVLRGDGALLGIAAIVEEITERKAIESQLREQADQLREAARRKDEFLTMLAHELRNPLAPIRNAVLVLQRMTTSEPALQRMQEIISRQVEHLARLVDDLLDVSRITQGKVTLGREIVDLNAVVSQAIDVVRPMIAGKHQDVVLESAPEPLEVNGDLVRLTQVVGNLLNNAVKYSDEGARVWLSAAREGDEAVVRVRDEGMGIPADLIPHVFDLFIQGKRALDRSQGGLGIGLSLVKSLVELHGGSVQAASAGSGTGSEFVVRLPLAARASSVPSLAPVSVAAAACRRVLIVDDNVDAAQSMKALLEIEGHDVRVEYDGATAIETARAWTPEIVLLDIGLPGIDGYEVARQLRSARETRDALLVAVTGYGQEDDRRRSQDAGFNQHLVKPVSLDDLRAMMTLVSPVGPVAAA